MRDQQPSDQAANLVSGQDYVAHDEAKGARQGCHRRRRCVQDRRAPADSVPDSSNELVKRHRVWPGRVHDRAAGTTGGLQADVREVVNVDWLHEVAAIARHDEDRHPPQNPSDVVG
jgi:hypothetical protein